MTKFKRLNLEQTAFFFEQLWLMVNTGMQLDDGLEILSEDIDDKNLYEYSTNNRFSVTFSMIDKTADYFAKVLYGKTISYFSQFLQVFYMMGRYGVGKDVIELDGEEYKAENFVKIAKKESMFFILSFYFIRLIF